MRPPAPVAVRRRARGPRRADARHPDHRHAGRPPQREVPPRRPALDRRRHPQERPASCSSTPTAPASRSRSALPGDREVDQKRLEGQMEPTEVEPMDEAEFARHPALVKGYIGPGVLGEKNASGIRYLVDPRVVEGTRWVTGADVAGSHVLDLVVGRDFTPDGTIEAADVRDGDPCPNCDGGVLESGPRHRDGPHLPARPQVRRRARPAGARRERQAGHGHHGLLRHRPLAGGGRDRRGHPRRARPVLAPRRRTGRRPRGRDRQGRGDLRRCRPARHASWPTTA